MNWIERMYELKSKDLYSQNGEGLYLEYVYHSINCRCFGRDFIDIGAGDGFNLSNTRHLKNLGWGGRNLDSITGDTVTRENILNYYDAAAIISIDIDGNDYWILDAMLSKFKASIVIAEFNPAFTDARVIEYNPWHVWDGTDYYGFSFKAGEILAEKYGYKIIFQVANMNIIMVREDLIDCEVPSVTFTPNKFFQESNRTDWVFV